MGESIDSKDIKLGKSTESIIELNKGETDTVEQAIKKQVDAINEKFSNIVKDIEKGMSGEDKFNEGMETISTQKHWDKRFPMGFTKGLKFLAGGIREAAAENTLFTLDSLPAPEDSFASLKTLALKKAMEKDERIKTFFKGIISAVKILENEMEKRYKEEGYPIPNKETEKPEFKLLEELVGGE